jgi:hypothetical protein
MWDRGSVLVRLSEMADRDPGCEHFGARSHRYRLGPALAESDVAGFEREYGVELPASYRQFLLEVGDGGAGPYLGVFRLDGSDKPERYLDEKTNPELLSVPFPHRARWNPNADACLMDDDEYFDPMWSAGSLVVGEYGSGAFFRLIVTGSNSGQVWFDDRSADGGLVPGPDFHDWYSEWLATGLNSPARPGR